MKTGEPEPLNKAGSREKAEAENGNDVMLSLSITAKVGKAILYVAVRGAEIINGGIGDD